MKDYYKVLGLEFANRNSISQEEIKKQYYKLVLQFHPDKTNDTNDSFIKDLNRAYEILSDETARASYDAEFARRIENKELSKIAVYELLTKCLEKYKLFLDILNSKVSSLTLRADIIGINRNPVFQHISEHLKKLKNIKTEMKDIISSISNFLMSHLEEILEELLRNLRNEDATKKPDSGFQKNQADAIKFLENNRDRLKITFPISRASNFFSKKDQADFRKANNSSKESTIENHTLLLNILMVELTSAKSLLQELDCKDLESAQIKLGQIISELVLLSDLINQDISKIETILKTAHSQRSHSNIHPIGVLLGMLLSLSRDSNLSSDDLNSLIIPMMMFSSFTAANINHKFSEEYFPDKQFDTEKQYQEKISQQEKLKVENIKSLFFSSHSEINFSNMQKISLELKELEAMLSYISSGSGYVSDNLIYTYSSLIAAYPESLKEQLYITNTTSKDNARMLLACAIEEKKFQLENYDIYDEIKNDNSRMLSVP